MLLSLSSIPVVFSPYYDRSAPPRLIDGIVYAHSEEHLKEWLETATTQKEG